MNKLMMLLILFSTSAMSDQSCHKEVSCVEERQCVYRKPVVRTVVKRVVVEKVVEKIVYVDRPVEKTVVVNQISIGNKSGSNEKRVLVDKNSSNRNSISLLGMATPTALNVQGTANNYKASTEYRPDLGLMYQRDFGDSVRGSLGATIRGNGLAALGWNF